MAHHTARRQARVLIAGGPELVRRGVRDVLSRDTRLHVAGESGGAGAAGAFDLVAAIAGERTAAETGAFAELEGAACGQGAALIVLAAGADAREVARLARLGAAAVLLCDAPGTLLLRTVDEVLSGGAALDPRLVRRLFEDWRAAAEEAQAGLAEGVLELLSARERDVLRALAQGRRNKEIAAELGVSVGTVKTHLRHIFRKLAVGDRTGAVLAAVRPRLRDAA